MNRYLESRNFHLFLAGVLALALAAPVHAARVTFKCDVAAVRQHAGSPGNPGRFEIKCKQPYAGNIWYFTISSSAASTQDVAQMVDMVMSHVSNTLYWETVVDGISFYHRHGLHQRVSTLLIDFDDADATTGPAYGCLATDCRHILAISVVPLNLSWSI